MAETQNSTTLSFSFSFILLFAQLCTALFFFFPASYKLLLSWSAPFQLSWSSFSNTRFFFLCSLFRFHRWSISGGFSSGAIVAFFFFSSFYLVYRHLYCYYYVPEEHTSAPLTPILVRSFFFLFSHHSKRVFCTHISLTDSHFLLTISVLYFRLQPVRSKQYARTAFFFLHLGPSFSLLVDFFLSVSASRHTRIHTFIHPLQHLNNNNTTTTKKKRTQDPYTRSPQHICNHAAHSCCVVQRGPLPRPHACPRGSLPHSPGPPDPSTPRAVSTAARRTRLGDADVVSTGAADIAHRVIKFPSRGTTARFAEHLSRCDTCGECGRPAGTPPQRYAAAHREGRRGGRGLVALLQQVRCCCCCCCFEQRGLGERSGLPQRWRPHLLQLLLALLVHGGLCDESA